MVQTSSVTPLLQSRCIGVLPLAPANWVEPANKCRWLAMVGGFSSETRENIWWMLGFSRYDIWFHGVSICQELTCNQAELEWSWLGYWPTSASRIRKDLVDCQILGVLEGLGGLKSLPTAWLILAFVLDLLLGSSPSSTKLCPCSASQSSPWFRLPSSLLPPQFSLCARDTLQLSAKAATEKCCLLVAWMLGGPWRLRLLWLVTSIATGTQLSLALSKSQGSSIWRVYLWRAQLGSIKKLRSNWLTTRTHLGQYLYTSQNILWVHRSTPWEWPPPGKHLDARRIHQLRTCANRNCRGSSSVHQLQWMVAKSESPVENGAKNIPLLNMIHRFSTILLVVQESGRKLALSVHTAQPGNVAGFDGQPNEAWGCTVAIQQ